jgi:hypothetical protein
MMPRQQAEDVVGKMAEQAARLSKLTKDDINSLATNPKACDSFGAKCPHHPSMGGDCDVKQPVESRNVIMAESFVDTIDKKKAASLNMSLEDYREVKAAAKAANQTVAEYMAANGGEASEPEVVAAEPEAAPEPVKPAATKPAGVSKPAASKPAAAAKPSTGPTGPKVTPADLPEVRCMIKVSGPRGIDLEFPADEATCQKAAMLVAGLLEG